MAILTAESQLREAIAITLRNLSNNFPHAMKLTLVVRHQSDDNAFAVFSEDPHLEKVIETIQKNIKKNAEKIGFAPPSNSNIILP